MKPPRDIADFAKNASIRTDETVNEQILQRMHQAYEDSARAPAEGRTGGWSVVSGGRIARLAVAALVLLAVGVLVAHLMKPLGSNVAWADVTRRFQAVPFFSATIYMKEGAASEPTQIELWMSRDERVRLRIGKQVVFGRGGVVGKAFDIQSRQPVEPEERAITFIEKIGQAGEFSLDAIVRVMFGGKAQDVTPLVNPDAVISQDVVVFDVEMPDTSEWVRIWALRESRLPVRIRIWNPTDGGMTDAVFEYSRGQPDEFFDPNAFGTLLQSRPVASGINIAYAFLQDPGGKNITPEEMFAGSGYHMPVLEQAGITPDGAVWVIATKGRNRMPNGYTFFGFGRLQDSLGREYHRVYASHRTATDQSMEAFVPVDYPFDGRIPDRIILVSEVDDYNPVAKREVIGTVELTDWARGQSWPPGTITRDERSFRTQMAGEYSREKRHDKAERILATIEGQPEDNPVALDRERVRLHMLLQQEKFDEAVTLGARLMPLLERDYRDWHGFVPTPSVFCDYIEALVLAGRLEQAKQTWQHIKGLQPERRPGLNEAARKRITENIQQEFDNCLRSVVPELSRRAHLTVEQLSEIFQVDVKGSGLFKSYTFWDWNPEFEKPKYRNWERHLAELTERYKTHPLPEPMEILKHTKAEEYGVRQTEMPGIPGYYVTPLSGKLKDYARFYNYPESVGRARVQEDIPDIVLDHDLICQKGTPEMQVKLCVLNHFGLEVVEVNEPHRVWIARYDGRKLKDYREVHAPVPLDGGPIRTGMMSASSSGGFDLSDLFLDFARWQDREGTGNGILIVDQTGIKEKVSSEEPQWEGPGALEMARQWFQEQLGITFTEETRTMKTSIVQRKR